MSEMIAQKKDHAIITIFSLQLCCFFSSSIFPSSGLSRFLRVISQIAWEILNNISHKSCTTLVCVMQI